MDRSLLPGDLKMRALFQAIYALSTQPNAWNEVLKILSIATRSQHCYVAIIQENNNEITAYCENSRQSNAYQTYCLQLLTDLSIYLKLEQDVATVIWNYTGELLGGRYQHKSVGIMCTREPLCVAILGLHANFDTLEPLLDNYRAKILSIALQHLATVLRVQMHIQDAQYRRTTASLAFACLPYGVIIIDRGGFIIEANPRADAALARCGLFKINQFRQLIAEQEADQRRIEDAFTALSQTKQSLSLFFNDLAKKKWEFRVTAISPWFCIEIREHLAPNLSEIVERICILYGVSPSERKVAHLLSQGISLKDASGILNLTEGTVQQYAHRIFGKIGVHSQREMICFLRNALPNMYLP